MALETQTIPIAFTQGVDTKTDPKQVGPGKLLSLTNGFFQNPGEIRKRYGYAALTQSTQAGGTLSTGVALSSYQSGLCMLDGTSLYAYSPSTTKWAVTDNPVVTASVSVSPAFLGSTPQSSGDSAYIGNIQIVVRQDGVRVPGFYSIIDTATGQKLVDLGTIDSNFGAQRIKVAAFQGRFIIFYYDSANHKLKFKTLTAASFASGLSASTDIATDINTTTPIYDVVVANQKLFVAYNATTPALKMPYIDTNFSVQAAVTVEAVATQAIGLFTDASYNVWVGYATSAAMKARVYNNAGTALTAATSLEATASVRNITGAIDLSSATTGRFFYEFTSGTTSYIQSATITTSAVTTAATTAIPTVGLASKAFVYSGAWHVLVAFPSAFQATHFLIKLDASLVTTVVAKIAPLIAGGLTTFASLLPEVNNLSTGVYQFTYLQTDRHLIAAAGGDQTNKGVMSATVTFGTTPVISEFQNNLHIGGGCLMTHDGRVAAEHNFHVFPEILSAPATAASGNIAVGTYSYVCVYESMDNQGQLHQSAPSPPKTVVVTSASSSVTLTIGALQITSRKPSSAVTPTYIAVYRTTAGGQIYYRLSGTNDLAASFGTNNTVSWADGVADASIIAGEELYTTGGEVDNGPPPAVYTMTPFKGRMIVIPADDRKSWWYSKRVLSGYPVEFSPFFVNPIDPRGGDITAAKQLDDKLIFFKQRNVFYTVGDGPAVNGTGSDYIDPQLITSDVGALSQASVIEMPFGLMFQSTKGFCLLDRSLAVQYIGADVEAYNGYTVTSSALVETANQVRFTMSNGVCLVYDYYVKQWSVYSNHSAVASTIYGSQFTYLNAVGKTFQESTTLFTDDGAFVQLSLLTSHLAFAGLQGYQRVYAFEVVGAWQSAHNLTVSVAYDYATTYAQTATIQSPTSVVPYQYGVQTAIQKCQAIQLLIQDVNTGTPGESVRLSGVNLLVGIKRGQNRLPASKTY